MPIACKYLHTNFTVKDIERMQAFYIDVFGCVPIRDIHPLTGKWIEDITTVTNGEIKYVHLRFPGHGDSGPELELVQYLNPIKKFDISPDTLGFGHLSFSVNNVHAALDAVISAGGGCVGEVVTVDVPNRGRLTEVYATDQEGNIIELQTRRPVYRASHGARARFRAQPGASVAQFVRARSIKTGVKKLTRAMLSFPGGNRLAQGVYC